MSGRPLRPWIGGPTLTLHKCGCPILSRSWRKGGRPRRRAARSQDAGSNQNSGCPVSPGFGDVGDHEAQPSFPFRILFAMTRGLVRYQKCGASTRCWQADCDQPTLRKEREGWGTQVSPKGEGWATRLPRAFCEGGMPDQPDPGTNPSVEHQPRACQRKVAVPALAT